jgi:protein phosphatase
MPWSAKAQELLRTQYAAVGSAGIATTGPAVALLQQAGRRLSGDATAALASVESEFIARQASVERFVAAYRQYCWPVSSLDDFKLAPFHLLATERGVHTQQNHQWHMQTLAKVCGHDSKLLLATEFRVVDVTNPENEQAAVAWWQALTARGGEGMVVKPLEFVARGRRGLIQPAVKCRGREYLRIIYGPDYDAAENLARLRSRNLSGKRSLALREFALGIEALERFVRKEPLRRVHECVFGVLALESEPVDPRL